jgi:zinc protease
MSSRKVFSALALWLLLSSGRCVWAQSFEVPFEVYRLDNGLRVILSEDHSSPTYSIEVVYDVGSRNELPGQTGIAHLFEHMMFQGSEKVGKGEHFILIQNNGGSMNGTTSPDRTNYFATLPSNQLDLGLFLEADRMRSLDISESNFENQRETVKEERRRSYDNVPYGRTFLAVGETAYESFAYSHPTIGSMEDLDAATLADAEAFFRQYYAPNNAVLALVGAFETEEALAKIEEYFGEIPSQLSPAELYLVEPEQTEERRLLIEDTFARLPRLDIAFKGPAGNTGDWYILAVLADVLGEGQSGRLYQRLVLDQQVALNVRARLDERRGPSLFRISATPAPDVELEVLEARIYEELDNLKAELVEDWEIEKVHAQIERRNAQELLSTRARAHALAENTVFYNEPGLINTFQQRYESVSKEGVRSAAQFYLKEINRTVVTTVPQSSESPSSDRRER